MDFADHDVAPRSQTSPPEKRPGTGRFVPEELNCFRRVPTPSAHIGRKAETYQLPQSLGGLRRVLSESGLQTLPRDWAVRSQFSDTSSDVGTRSNAGRPFTPLEEKTAMVLDQIFPKNSQDALDREAMRHSQDGSRSPVKKGSKSSVTSPTKGDRGAGSGGRQDRLLRLRQKLLERFSSMNHAFDIFGSDANDYEYSKELSHKQFIHFLGKHFASLGREEHERIFELLDADKSGGISLNELHVAIEAAAPVKNLDDLRRKWIALGFSSMRQAIGIMEAHCSGMSKRLGFGDLASALSRVGITDEKEHDALFTALTSATSTTTTSLDELVSGLASVSPSLLLEDIRDRLLKRHGSMHQAFRALNAEGRKQLTLQDFIYYATSNLRLSSHEAAKAFHIIDIDGSGRVSPAEFAAALRLSEPGLFYEDLRKKVRQRYKSIRHALSASEQDVQDTAAVRTTDEDDESKVHSNGLLHASSAYHDSEGKTVSEFSSILASVQLVEPDTQMLFDLIDINGKGKLTPLEFVRALRIFAPSCILEDLRLRCLFAFSCVQAAFADAGSEATLLDQKMFWQILEDLELASEINADAVFSLVENRRDGGLHMNELLVALQSAAPGLQVPLPARERSAKARQQVKGQLAPFHRSALEVRSQVRQKYGGADEDGRHGYTWSVTESSSSGSSTMLHHKWLSKGSLGYSGGSQSCSLLPELTSSRSIWQTPPSSPSKKHAISPGNSFVQSLSPLSPGDMVVKQLPSPQGAMAHQPTKHSHKKVTQLLQARPPSLFNRKDGEGDPILDRIHDYYLSAGDTVASDIQLLKSPPKQLSSKNSPTKSRRHTSLS